MATINMLEETANYLLNHCFLLGGVEDQRANISMCRTIWTRCALCSPRWAILYCCTRHPCRRRLWSTATRAVRPGC